jgi:hypothetical protein
MTGQVVPAADLLGRPGAPRRLLPGQTWWNGLARQWWIGEGDDGEGRALMIRIVSGEGASPGAGAGDAAEPATGDDALAASRAWVRGQGYLTDNQIVRLSGDVEGEGRTVIPVTLRPVPAERVVTNPVRRFATDAQIAEWGTRQTAAQVQAAIDAAVAALRGGVASTRDTLAELSASIDAVLGPMPPAALDTIRELSAALQDNPAVVTQILAALALRLPLDQSATLPAGQIANVFAQLGLGSMATQAASSYLARSGGVVTGTLDQRIGLAGTQRVLQIYARPNGTPEAALVLESDGSISFWSYDSNGQNPVRMLSMARSGGLALANGARIDDAGRILSAGHIMFRGVNAQGTALANGTTILPFAHNIESRGGGFAGAAGRFTAPVAGAYKFEAQVGLLGGLDDNGYAGVRLLRNGLPVPGADHVLSRGRNFFAERATTARLILSAGDYVEVAVLLDQIVTPPAMQLSGRSYFQGGLIS